MIDPDTVEIGVEAILDTPSASMPSLRLFSRDSDEDVEDAVDVVQRILEATLEHTQIETLRNLIKMIDTTPAVTWTGQGGVKQLIEL